MTFRSLSLLNDNRQLSDNMQLRNTVSQVIELGGNVQGNNDLSADVWNPVYWTEVVRQSGTYTNFIFPVRFPNNPAFGIIYTDMMQVTVSGYYSVSFKYAFSLITEASIRLNIMSGTTLLRYEQQTMPVANKGVANWMLYIEAGQNISITIDPAAATRIPPDDYFVVPRLVVAQIAQFDDPTAGQASTVESSLYAGFQSITSGTTTAVNFDTIPNGYYFVQAPTDTWSNSGGGGNQLGFISGVVDNNSFNQMVVKKSSLYYISACVGIGYIGGGVGVGGRSLMLLKNTTSVLATQAVDCLNSVDRPMTVSTTAYLVANDVIQVAVLQTSGFAQDVNLGSYSPYPRFSIMDLG